jgi:hypothetical protein
LHQFFSITLIYTSFRTFIEANGFFFIFIGNLFVVTNVLQLNLKQTMMKRNLTIVSLLLLLAISFIFNACKKTSTTPASDTQLLFAFSGDNPITPLDATTSTILAATQTASVSWTSGSANISAFKFEAKKNNTEIEITSKGLINIDLFTLLPTAIGATIDTGVYKEIELRVLLVKSTTTAIPLVLKGSYTSQSGVITPVEFDFNDDALIKVEVENIIVDGKTDLAAAIKLSTPKMVNGIVAADLDAATRSNGTIVISNASNTNIYNKIKTNLFLSTVWNGFEHREKSERK